ncbi:hypothetical protein HPB51_019446 [Rhipicephalus microplus]|uniref:Uncharacterized protein n=1 Tax=Rhipicephalus microplus TaxID=6941 RepID=A0A9J6DPS9_RHIMP|nr:hypothetical protein HPB51_019446 [Rhipicephalus microplus]
MHQRHYYGRCSVRWTEVAKLCHVRRQHASLLALQTPDGHLLRLREAESPRRRVPGPEGPYLKGMRPRDSRRRPRVLSQVCLLRRASSYCGQRLQARLPNALCRPPQKEAGETRYQNTYDAGDPEMQETGSARVEGVLEGALRHTSLRLE